MGMKKAIDLLERAEALLMVTFSGGEDSGECDEIINYLNDAMAILKAHRWIPYKELSDAHDYMSEAIKAIEGVESCSREEKKRIRMAVDRTECAMGAVETLIPLPLPRWSTPEQWEKRTGEPWPDNGAVYWRMRDDKKSKWYEWFPMPYEMAELAIVKTIGEHQVVCATEAGPPPENWRPE
jgi:hypothetical protein